MRRKLSSLMVVLSLLAAPAVYAQDSSASDAPKVESTETTSDGGVSLSEGGGGTGVRAAGALLDKSEFSRPMMLSFHLLLPYGYYWAGFGVGVGARFAIPIVKNGFLPMLNDSFWIEFGADFRFHFPWWGGFGFGFTIPAEVMWMFHIFKNFAAYAKLSLGLGLTFVSLYAVPGAVGNVWASFHGEGAVGILYNVGEKFALRAEVGNSSFKAGISIMF